MLDFNSMTLCFNPTDLVKHSTSFLHAVWAFRSWKYHKWHAFCPLSQQRAILQRHHDTESSPTVLPMWGIMELITSTVRCREPLHFFLFFIFEAYTMRSQGMIYCWQEPNDASLVPNAASVKLAFSPAMIVSALRIWTYCDCLLFCSFNKWWCCFILPIWNKHILPLQIFDT